MRVCRTSLTRQESVPSVAFGAYSLVTAAGVHIPTLKHDDHFRLIRTVREGIVIVIVCAFAIGVFVAVIRVMAPGEASQAESTAAPVPAPAPADAYEDSPESSDAP